VEIGRKKHFQGYLKSARASQHTDSQCPCVAWAWQVWITLSAKYAEPKNINEHLPQMHTGPKNEVSEPGICFNGRAEDNLAAFTLVASLDKGRY